MMETGHLRTGLYFIRNAVAIINVFVLIFRNEEHWTNDNLVPRVFHPREERPWERGWTNDTFSVCEVCVVLFFPAF